MQLLSAGGPVGVVCAVFVWVLYQDRKERRRQQEAFERKEAARSEQDQKTQDRLLTIIEKNTESQTQVVAAVQSLKEFMRETRESLKELIKDQRALH